MKSIAILGCGKMGQVIAEALVTGAGLGPYSVSATVRRSDRADELSKRGVGSTLSNVEAVRGCDFLILAVKPKDIAGLLDEIQPFVKGGHVVVSVAAGITTSFLESRLGSGVRVIRAMPNLPSKVHEGLTALVCGAEASEQDMIDAAGMFAALGKTVEVPEELINAVTALSGSGPAYFAYFTQAMIEAGIDLGLDEGLARKLALQTLAGTAKFLTETDYSPDQLQAAVTSPGGTTEAAIKELEKSGAAAALKSAIKAAAEKAQDLSQG